MRQLISVLSFILACLPAFSQSNEIDQNWTAEINTVKDAFYLSQYEKEIILELNKVRTNPEKYATDYLVPLKDSYDGLIFNYPGQIPLRTKEGIKALEECIKDLTSAASVSVLTPSRGMCKAARLLVDDQKIHGGTGHLTKSGWTPDVRLKRYGTWKFKMAENIVYGYSDARRAVISLLIDDGVADRGHRKHILDSKFLKAGVASDKHPKYNYSCTIIFTDDFTEKR